MSEVYKGRKARYLQLWQRERGRGRGRRREGGSPKGEGVSLSEHAGRPA